ncbi:dioxygenase [Aestuariibacter sp. GS-14]|uniref:DODA-type extradiol aromatic ring-opening family dioxygenase n=1 Tax=Aestuariibacter sp. GS-14 TaxID=2590670 RepID=UPI0011298413|nr:class III extradiol ring-cleavage dioxygenase [Aestuariibacter sp. GS-14]TPV54308.1 dioxygenase [Aestuariibacter sp. GS-14]
MATLSQCAAVGLMPVAYVPHGGGPFPLMGEPNHAELIRFLKALPSLMPKPKAIVMISAHWESNVISVSSGLTPPMIYDYWGFPAETYDYQYPAPGDPKLAKYIANLIIGEGLECTFDSHRGFDHGTFVPLMLMYPKATIPVVQVSLKQSLDPAEHIALGKALAPLRAKGVLIIGSGMSHHSIKASTKESEDFDNWLTQTLVKGAPQDVTDQLIYWAKAPAAKACHPREEHLIPLHVCWGAVSNQCYMAEKVFSAQLMGKWISAFIWR